MSWAAVIIGGAALVGGIVQSSSANKRAKKAESQMDKLKNPDYEESQSILDYYNKAMERYNQNQYQSAMYQYGTQQGQRNTAAGLNAMQDRNSAVGGVSRLTALQNDNALKTGMAAENAESQRFSQLGSATQLRSADEQYKFNVDELWPYQQKMNMLAAKASGATQVANAGWQNMSNGLGTAATGFNDYYGSRNIYGNSNSSLGQVDATQGSPSWLQGYQDPGLTQTPYGGGN